MAEGTLNIVETLVGGSIIGDWPVMSTVAVQTATIGATFDSPISGKIRGIGIHVPVFVDDEYEITLRLIKRVRTSSGALASAEGPIKNFTLKDPTVHSDGDASPILRFDPSEYFQVNQGERVDVLIEGVDPMGDGVEIAYISGAANYYPFVSIDAVPTANAMPVIAIDYDTGNLLDYSKLIAPTGCIFASSALVADADLGDIEGVRVEFHSGIQTKIDGYWARCFVAEDDEYSLSDLSGEILDLQDVAGNFAEAVWEVQGIPYIMLAVDPFIVGLVGEDPEPDEAEAWLTFAEAGMSVIEDLAIQRLQGQSADLNKSTIRFGETLKALENPDGAGGFAGQFGSAYAAGFIVSEFREPTADEMDDILLIVGAQVPGDLVDVQAELAGRPGFNPMAITPADVQLAKLLNEMDRDAQ